MKMVKKILFGLVAVAAVLSLASCGVKDDPEGIIKGGAGRFSVNYTYDGDTEYRAYRSTGAKHSGALVKISFNEADIANAGNSKFGLIFGLKETKNGDQKIRNFYIAGLGANGQYYVSKFENVVDIQAKNFGAGTTYTNNVSTTGPNGEKETIISEGGTDGIHDGTLYTKEGEDPYAYIWYQIFTDGSIHLKIGNMADDKVTEWKNKIDNQMQDDEPTFSATLFTTTISGAYDDWSAEGAKAPQDYPAVYARVQGQSTLNGKVVFQKDFKEAEDIEEID